MKFITEISLVLALSFGFMPFCMAQQTTEQDSVLTTKNSEASVTKKNLADSTAVSAVQNTVASKISDTASLNNKILSPKEIKRDSVPFEKFKIDGVAAVIGERLILASDIQKMYRDLESQGIPTENITDCQLAERLMKNKLYAHQAIQDSLVVDEKRIRASTKQQIDYFVRQAGSIDKVLEFYNIESETELRNKLFEINKEQRLAKMMQQKIVEKIEITPEEVREFFDEIPKDERPKFGDEVEIAQIVIKPEVPKEEIKETIAKLNEFRDEILAGESSFATKAVLYSDDPGSSSKGGKMTMTRDSKIVQEFKDVAFSMQEGEISKPFKTEYGYHILMVDRIRGQQLDVRHILLIPDQTDESIQAAKSKIDSVRQLIVNEKISFADAARKFSDQKETRGDGGKLINPVTGDTRFEQAKVDPTIYNQVVDLKEGELSGVLTDSDRTGNIFFKIITVNERYPAHVANYAQDFAKIKELALTEKKLEVIEEWQKNTIKETYIKINGKYRECDFLANWLKK